MTIFKSSSDFFIQMQKKQGKDLLFVCIALLSVNLLGLEQCSGASEYVWLAWVSIH